MKEPGAKAVKKSMNMLFRLSENVGNGYFNGFQKS